MEEDENLNMDNEHSQKNERGFRETFKSGTPDEVRDKVKNVVEKGVAAVAGALRGFSDKAEKEHISESTKGAIHQAGEATRSTVAGVTEEVKNLKEPLRDAGQKLRETARDMKQTVRSEVDSTKSAVREYESGGTYGPTMGMGGSSLEGDTEKMKESEFPDIRNTPMAESDKKLQGRDLAKDLEEE